jgi:ABC-type amino acid transport substrate-binding protein
MNNVTKGVILVLFLGLLCAVGGMSLWAVMGDRTPDRGAPELASRPPDRAPVEAPGPKGDERVAAPAAGAAVERIRRSGALRVVMDTGEPPWTGTPPMYVKNADGLDAGFDIEVARVIATSLGVADVKVVHARYSELADALRDPSDRADLLISGYSPVPTDGVTWSSPYLEYGLCLVVPARSTVRSTADLFGQPVGIFDDDAAAEEVGKLVKGYTELVRLEDGYWDQLLSGRFAGFIYDYPYAVAEINRFYAQNPHRKGAFRIAQYNLSASTYAVGVRQADADLVGAVNAALTAWMDSPAYEAAIRAWLSSGLAAAEPADKGRKSVKVAPGDTLSRIAARYLGSAERWKEIWASNKDRFPNPHLIEVGDIVVLP